MGVDGADQSAPSSQGPAAGSPDDDRNPHVSTSTTTEREIRSQPEVWARAVAAAPEGAPVLGRRGERVLVLGCGTVAFVAESFAVLRERAGHGDTDAAYASEPDAWRAPTTAWS